MRRSTKIGKENASPNIRQCMAHMMRELMDGVTTVNEMRRVSALSESTIRCWIRELKKMRVIRICGWDNREALYEFNPRLLPDVKYVRMSGAEKLRRWRTKQAGYTQMQKLIAATAGASQI